MRLFCRRFALFISLCWAGAACAQAAPTANKILGIGVFGGFSILSPNYGAHTNYGAFAGADLTHSLRHFTPSLEVRYTDATGVTAAEDSFLGGPKVEKKFGRFHPYADALFGYGAISFEHPVIYPTGPYAHDNSFVVDAGGGLDYDVSTDFSFKADLQYQWWHLGNDVNLSPHMVGIGLLYRLPFRALRRY